MKDVALDQAYKQGRQAFMNGDMTSANPYFHGYITHLSSAWVKGWNSREQEVLLQRKAANHEDGATNSAKGL